MGATYKIEKLETEVIGLKYEPSLVDGGNNRDSIEVPEEIPPDHWTKNNEKILVDVFDKVKDNVKFIFEIGVHRPWPPESTRSSTKLFRRLKTENMIYLGIDLRQRVPHHHPELGMYTRSCHSDDTKQVRNFMKEHDIDTIDFMFIDGNHSISQVIRDWSYIEWLSPDGVVVFHDTNWHPGPVTVFDAIDETMFDKEKFLEDEDDWGIGVAYRKY